VHLFQSILLSLLAGLTLCAGQAEPQRGVPMDALQVWMRENVEDWVFDLAAIDRETLDQSLDQVQQVLERVPAPEPAPSRSDAEQVLLALRQLDPTRSCATWLEEWLDRMDRADSSTNAALPVATQASPQALFEFWLGILTNRPAPVTAADYLVQLKPIFQAEKVPVELVWVAEVESAFDPHARSPVGAVGLFQLMPETARSLGLSTWLPDDRRVAEKNARAAARYLQYLHDRFGDWRLALAAYNAGPTRVSKLLKKSETYSYDAIVHQLPGETRAYVAKVEATLLVREGVQLLSLPTKRG
jgi:membrane-bound lytic murein transglycosylase D